MKDALLEFAVLLGIFAVVLAASIVAWSWQ